MMGINLSWRDLLLSVLLVLFAQVILAQPTDPENLLKPPGNLMIYTTWNNVPGNDDVDTWFFGPQMVKPIGYDNKDAPTCNLVKDDLGGSASKLPVNFENIFCRATPDGEYVINIHAFSVYTYPTVVNVQVVMNINGVTRVLFDEEITLKSPKDEVTVIRFRIKDGQVVPGSAHHTFISLFNMVGE